MKLDPDKAYSIDVDGVISEITPVNGKTFELEEAQKLVEGYIEIVYLNGNQIMIVNEEGKLGKSYNCLATGIAEFFKALWDDDYICGNVVICPSSMLS